MQLSTSQLVLDAEAAIDLQMHTTYSDGVWRPEELIDHLAEEGFALAAITDHDRIDTAAALQELAIQKKMPLLVAAELTGEWNGELAEVLSYGFDPDNQALRALIEPVVARRHQNLRDVYNNLLRAGYEFPRQAEVLRASNGEVTMAKHLVYLVKEHGYVTEEKTLHTILIEEAGYYEPTCDVALIVEAVHNAGGVCLMAHPGRAEITLFDVEKLERLRREVPFDGIEIHYPVHTEEQIQAFLHCAESQNLLVSSGSDTHGPDTEPIKYPARLSRKLLARLGIEVR